jgi:excinuclease ABC subunit C
VVDYLQFNIQEELKKLPAKPGVYLMHDAKDEIIYVGKAVVLKNRVRQYFQSGRNVSPKIERMIAQIDHFEYIVTDSELEALVLESNLIKEHRPKYNTMLKDDKSYPYIKATVGEAFPRLLFSRKGNRGKKEDKVKYFGPYTSAGAVKDTLELMRKIYHIRTCNRVLPRDAGKERPCLYHQIGQCHAPCTGKVSKEEYRKEFQQAMEFLNGNYQNVLNFLEQKMLAASEQLEFEAAAQYRDLLNSVKQIAQKQKITSEQTGDRDILALAKADREAVVQVFFIRGGKLIGREHFYLTGVEEETRAGLMQSFLKQFYSGTPYIPSELLMKEEIEEIGLLEEWLGKKRGQKVHIRITKKGEKERLVSLAEQNALLVLQKDAERTKREEAKTRGAMKEISDWLGMEHISRVESFDISNINGFESVGSMVVFENGKPQRNDYRKFKIKWVKGANDYASMQEVLTRRFVHGMEEQKELKEKDMDASYGKFTRFPDIIMMDGGKGQVHIAEQVLAELKLSIPVCGMVKDDNHRTRGLFFHDVELPIDTTSEGFHLITRIQDETHRFAIEYHRSLRSKAQIHSILDDIPNIGPARRKALRTHFQSMEAIQGATVEEMQALPGMNRKAAEAVFQFFREMEGK